MLHRDGVIPIHTPVTFEVGFFQSQKLKRNGYMIPLSRIEVCHSSRIVTPVHTLLATRSRPERVATSGGLYPSHQIAESVELSSIVTSSLSNPSSSNITPTQTPTALNISQIVWGDLTVSHLNYFLSFCIPLSSINLGYGYLVYFIFIQYDYNLP